MSTRYIDRLLGLAFIVYGALLYGLKLHFSGSPGYFMEFDANELIADGLRLGQLGLNAAVHPDLAKVFLPDGTPRGDTTYFSYGYLVPAVYALFDIVSEFITGRAFPKVVLLAVVLSAHLAGFYAVLRSLITARPWIAFGFTVLYSISSPFWICLREGNYLSEVTAWFSCTFFMWAVWFAIKLLRGDTRKRVFTAAAVLCCCALLTRPIYFVHCFVLSAILTFFARSIRGRVLYAVLMFSGVGVQFLINYIRFENVLDFGEVYGKYNSHWEEVVYGMFMPFSWDRVLARFQVAFQGFTAINIGRDLAAAKGDYYYDPFTLWVNPDPWRLAERAPILFFGFVAGLALWFRHARRYAVELFLGAVVLSIYLLHTTFSQGWEFRYALSIWPLLFILMVKASNDVGCALIKHRANDALVGAALLVLVAVAHDYREVREQGFDDGYAVFNTKPLRERSLLANGEIGDELEQIPPLADLRALDCADILPLTNPPWFRTVAQFGIDNRDGRCQMRFYSGATLSVEPESKCRVELTLTRYDMDDCSRVTLHLDGEDLGPLKELGGTPGAIVCGQDLKPRKDRLILAWFLFSPVDFSVYDFKRDTPRYEMSRLAVNCDLP